MTTDSSSSQVIIYQWCGVWWLSSISSTDFMKSCGLGLWKDQLFLFAVDQHFNVECLPQMEVSLQMRGQEHIFTKEGFHVF